VTASPWDRVVGHAPQRRIWLAMRASGRIPHALLLIGAPGIGKRTWALAAAQDLLCHAPGDQGPCGRCTSCVAVSAGSHPDLIQASPGKGGHYRVGQEVDEIQPLIEQLNLTPALSKAKVLVMDKAEGLSRYGGRISEGNQAADAFLKILEEPTPDTTLFLIAARTDLPPTVLSRCSRLFFSPLDRETFRTVLRAQRADLKLEETLYRLSRGSPGESLALLARGALDLRGALGGLPGAPRAKALALASEILLPAKPSSRQAAAQEATPLALRRQEALARLQILASLLRDRLPGLPPEARLNPDLPPAPPGDVRPMGRALRETLDAIQGNADLTLSLECCAISLAG
jgi:DNA polymerase-3 subunit delta'